MAKAKKKNTVKITSVKMNSAVLKKGVKTTTVVNKKPRQEKKKDEVDTKKINAKVKASKGQVKNTVKANTSSEVIKPEQKDIKVDVLTQEAAIAKRKERNRKKYENQQKKYRNDKEKKKIVVENTLEEKISQKEDNKKEVPITETNLVKKAKCDDDTKKKEIDKQRKEKRKTNQKMSGIVQTLNNIKEKSVTTIIDVREITSDETIPIGKSYVEKTKRTKRLVKEAIVYAILLTIINVLCIVFIDYFNFIRLFDVKALNVVLTVVVSLLFNFFVAFMIDYFVTNMWLTRKRKKKDGEQNGNNRVIKGEHTKDIKDKKRK